MMRMICALLLICAVFLNTNANNDQVDSELINGDNEKILQMVHVVMRHGIRTPVSTYPLDPYKDFDFAPNGWGRLTIHGIQELHNFGQYLNDLYGDFLGCNYNATEYYSQATGVDRAIASIMTVNSGLWQPLSNDQRWNERLDWYPIPVFSEPLDSDKLLLVRKDCPQYNIELARVESSDEVLKDLESHKELFDYVEKNTGQKVRNFYDLEDVYTTLQAEEAFGLTLPPWTSEYYPCKMQEAASKSFVLKAFNTNLQRLKGGVLLKKILENISGKITNENPLKMILLGGHDTTISNLLSALKMFEPQVPNYGMAIFFELFYHPKNSKYSLEIFVKNSTEPRVQMLIPGCEKSCPIEDVLQITEPVIPQNWHLECATDDPNYTTRAPTGP